MLIITGCPRSGTLYIATVLQRAGIKVKHEKVGPDGIVSFTLAADTKGSSVGPGFLDLSKGDHTILHQVRDPFMCIQSMQCLEASMPWMAKILNTPADRPLLYRLAHYWLEWNKLAEEKAIWTYRIESLLHVLPTWCKCTNSDILKVRRILATLHTDINTKHQGKVKGYIRYSREAIKREASDLWPELCQVARRYGYDT